ncbi:MAG: hypothetical protein WDW36_006717 [Sanguina aurantia]
MTPTTPRVRPASASPPPPNECSFSLLHDKPLSGGVTLGCWSPTMDLLALIMEDGQLCVHRLDWSKLWLAVPSSPVTAMCWRPDGRLLAIGHEDGSHSLYDIERACLSHHSPRLHACQITGLSWVESNPGPMGANATRQPHYRHARFFAVPPFTPPLRPPTQQQTAAAASWMGSEGDSSSSGGGIGSGPGSLDILVSTSASGSVALSAFGSVLVATVQIVTTPPPVPTPASPQTGQPAADSPAASTPHTSTSASQPAAATRMPPSSVPPPTVRMHAGPAAQCQSFLARDLALLFGVGAAGLDACQGQGGATGARGGSGSSSSIPEAGPLEQQGRQLAVLRVWDTRVLQAHQKGVTMVSLLTSELLNMLTVCSAALASAHKDWSAAQGEMTQRLGQLEAALRDHGSQQLDEMGGAAGQAATMADGMDPDQEDDSMVVVDELVGMLATGHVSPALQAFLAGGLKESGLRKLAKALDNSVQGVHALLLDHVAPAAEVATFILGELKGMAAAAEGGQLLGVSELACTRAEMAGAKVLLQCESLRVTLTRVGVQYRALWLWLMRTLQRLELESGAREGDGPTAAELAGGTQVDVMAVLDCLEGQLQEDQVGQDLQECPYRPYNPVGSLGHSPALLPTLKALMDVMYTSAPVQLSDEGILSHQVCGGLLDGDGGAHPPPPKTAEDETWLTRPLRAQLLALQRMCVDTLRQVPLHLSPRFVLLMEVPLFPVPHPLSLRVSPGTSHSTPLPLRCTISLPQLKTEQSSGPVQLCCLVPDCTASAGHKDPQAAAPESLLLLQLSRGQGRQQQQQVKVHAAVQQLPMGVQVSDLAFYKSAQVLLMLHSSAAATPRSQTPAPQLPPLPPQPPSSQQQQQQQQLHHQLSPVPQLHHHSTTLQQLQHPQRRSSPIPLLHQQASPLPTFPSPSEPHAPRRSSFSNQSPVATYGSSTPSTPHTGPNAAMGVGRLLRRRSGSVAMVSVRVEGGGGGADGTASQPGGETAKGGEGTPARTPGGGWGGSGEDTDGSSLLALLPAVGPQGGPASRGMVRVLSWDRMSVLQLGGLHDVALSNLRSRRCPMGAYTAPLLSGAARGTAAVFSSMSRVQVLDVEEDDGDEQEDVQTSGSPEDAVMQEGPDA